MKGGGSNPGCGDGGGLREGKVTLGVGTEGGEGGGEVSLGGVCGGGGALCLCVGRIRGHYTNLLYHHYYHCVCVGVCGCVRWCGCRGWGYLYLCGKKGLGYALLVCAEGTWLEWGGGGGLQPTVCNGECLSVSLGLQSGLEQSPCPWWRGWVVWVSLEHLLMMLVTQRAGPVSMVERLGSLGFSGAPADDAQSGLVPT